MERGKISFVAAVLMSLNIIIGGGILFNPAPMAAAAGNASFLTWIVVALLFFPIVWALSQASQVYTGGSGFYHYCSTGINKTYGFIAHWAYLLGYLSTAAALTTSLRLILAKSVGWDFFTQSPMLFNIVVVGFFSLFNLLSVTLVSKIQSSATLLKMTPLFIGILLFPFFFKTSFPISASDISGLGMAIPLAVFGYWGFEACCSIGNLLAGGTRQVGKVILTAFFICALLYTLFHFSILHIMGKDALVNNGVIAFPQYLGLSPFVTQALQWIIGASIILSFANSVFGISLSNMYNFFMLAENNLIFGSKVLKKVNLFNQPTYIAILHAIVVCTLLFFVTEFGMLTALTNLGVSVALLLTLVALFITFLQSRSFLKLSMIILGFVSLSALVYFSWISISPDPWIRIVYASPVLIGIVVGLIMYKMLTCTKCCLGNSCK